MVIPSWAIKMDIHGINNKFFFIFMNRRLYYTLWKMILIRRFNMGYEIFIPPPQ